LVCVYGGADVFQIDVSAGNRPDFRGGGVAPSVLFHVARHENARVRSSSNMNAAWVLPHEVRSAPANAMWQRMQQRGSAHYDDGEDRYYLLTR